MFRTLLAAAILLSVFLPFKADAQVVTPTVQMQPVVEGSNTLSVSNTSNRVALSNSTQPTLWITNQGVAGVCVVLGGLGVIAPAPVNGTCLSGFYVGAGQSPPNGFGIAGNTYLAATSPLGTTTTLNIVEGYWQQTSSANPSSTSTIPLATTTTDGSSTITTGGTFQTVLAASSSRKSFEFTNVCQVSGCVSPTDYCYITTVGFGSATKANSIPIPPGGSYLRSSGAVPSDAIAATCDGTGDHYRLASQ